LPKATEVLAAWVSGPTWVNSVSSAGTRRP
jgi:hypothetical protein